MFKQAQKGKKEIKKHLITHKKKYFIVLGVLLFILIFGGGLLAGYFYFNQDKQNPSPETTIEIKDSVYLSFLSEIYDIIKENHWQELSDEELSNLFKLGAEKLTQTDQTLNKENKQGVNELMAMIIENMDEEQKEKFSASLAHLVLINLKPVGRSKIFTKKQEEELQDRVQNVNPDTGKVESTVYTKLVRPDILHLYIKRMSPTTLDDLKKETEKVDNIDGLDTLILDLRGNIGGSLDIILYLLGPFIGNNQYAFELFHQGDSTPFKTKFGWLPSLVRYKKVVILIDQDTQSSAEVIASTLKKYNVGVLVGTKTKGWGTIEKVYEIENQISSDEEYSMFLVHALTLRQDNQPIEENGVIPLININDSNWKEQLLAYFNYNELIEAVEEVWNTSPKEIL